MSFTRLMYDEDSYKQELYESTKPNRYLLLQESTSQGGNTCFQGQPEIQAASGSRSMLKYNTRHNNMVNAESDLWNLMRKDSKDPKSKFPYTKVDHGMHNNTGLPQLGGCTKTELIQSHQLLDGNQFKREQKIAIPRFESLCLYPQESKRIRSNNYIGLNTRLYNRDNHKPNVPVAKSQIRSLPQSNGFVSPMETFFQQVQAKKAIQGGKKEGFSGCSAGCSS